MVESRVTGAKRVFFAIELPDDIRERLAAIQGKLRPSLDSARWVRPENLHLTMRFVGNVDGATLEPLTQRLSTELGRCDRFSLHFQGLGFFPNAKRPRVLWVGLESLPGALIRARDVVERAVVAAGLEPERRAFRPHLTLARFRGSRAPAAEGAIAADADREIGRTAVTEVCCFESRLSPRGARYQVLERFPLGGSEGPTAGS